MTPQERLAEIRPQISALQDERRRVARCLVPPEERFAAMQQSARERALKSIDIRKLLAPETDPAEPGLLVGLVETEIRRGFKNEVVDLRDLSDWICASTPKNVLSILHDAAAQQLEGVETMPSAEREQRLAELDEQILELELEEESECRRAESLGIDDAAVDRRPDARPEIILAGDSLQPLAV